MAILGNSTTPLSGFQNPGSGWGFASSFTTPGGAGIIVTTLHAYFDSASGASTGWCCVWDSGGTLLASVNIGSLNVKTGGVGNALDWWSGNLATPIWIAPGVSIWIGGYANGSTLFNSGSGGTSNMKSMGGSGPTSFAGSGSSGIGTVGAYLDYSTGGAYVRRSGVWVPGPANARRGSSNILGVASVRRGAGWTAGN